MGGEVDHNVLLVNNALAVLHLSEVAVVRSRYCDLLHVSPSFDQLCNHLSPQETSATGYNDALIRQVQCRCHGSPSSCPNCTQFYETQVTISVQFAALNLRATLTADG